jgi:hypothetical protein
MSATPTATGWPGCTQRSAPGEPGRVRRVLLGLALLSACSAGTEVRGEEPPSGALVSGLALTRTPDALLPATDGAGELASRIVGAEGGPRPNPASSAAGYGQFLRGTWLEMFVRAYPRVAQQLTSEQILALREVKPLAVEITGRYAQENASSLRRAGLPATAASLSLAHALGAGGAINVLVSRPEEPVENVLSAEAVAANPFLKEMTAGALKRWAADRLRLAIAPPAARPAPPAPDDIEPIRPAEDFRIDGHTLASQALAENRKAIADLQVLLDAFDESAARLALGLVHQIAARPAYREFRPIEGNIGAHGGLRVAVVRDIARALLAKMQRENETILAILRHRRNSGGAPKTAGGFAAGEGT